MEEKIPYKKLSIVLGILIIVAVFIIIGYKLLVKPNDPDIAQQTGSANPTEQAVEDSPVATPKETPKETKVTQSPVTWKDAALERLVREQLNKPEGDIYIDELEAITELHIWGNALSPGKTDEIIASAEKFTRNDVTAAAEIKNIEDLRYFKNLQRLTLCHQLISDFAPLESLTKLEYLVLTNDGIEEPSFLKSLPLLTSLRLDYNAISSLNAISDLKNLKYLDISHNEIDDLSELAKISGLETLILNQEGLKPKDYVRLKDISDLKNLTSLRRLSLRSQEIEDITALSSLTGLEELDLRYNNVWDFSPLATLKKLSSLWMKGYNFSTHNLAFLRELPLLTTTDLDEADWEKINYPFHLTAEDAVEGIYPGNLANGGFTAFDGTNVYYEYVGYGDLAHPSLIAFDINALKENYLSGVITEQMGQLTGQEPGGGINERISFLNAYKGKLYFMSNGHNNDTADALEDGYYSGDVLSGLTVMNQDGSGRMLLSLEPHSYINVSSNKIYSLNQHGFPTVMNLDGSKEEILLSEPCTMLYVDGQTLYYQEDSASGLFKMSLDTLQSQVVVDTYCQYPIILGDKIYYMDQNQGICEYDVNSRQVTVHQDKPVSHYNVSRQYLFYTSEAGIFRKDRNGGEWEAIYSGYANLLNVIDDYVFFDTGEGYAKIKSDGTEYVKYFEYF